VAVVVPQCATDRVRDRVGVRWRVEPVHANRARRCAIFQSVVPVRWRTAREAMGDLGEIRAVMGVVVVRRWYRKEIPIRARRSGERRVRVETVVVGSPETETRVPRRVWSGWEGERVMESSE
jgi:hypothetical protein